MRSLEGCYDDLGDELVTNISTCFTVTQANGQTVYTPKNAQGQIAQTLFNKNPHNYLIQLYCPLQHLGSLLPSNVDFGLKIQFTDFARFFVTETSKLKRPKYIIKVRKKESTPSIRPSLHPSVRLSVRPSVSPIVCLFTLKTKVNMFFSFLGCDSSSPDLSSRTRKPFAHPSETAFVRWWGQWKFHSVFIPT